MTRSYEERRREALEEQHRKCFDPERRALREDAAEYIDCPVCGSDDHALAFVKDWFTFSRCNRCSMVYLNPRLTERATYDFYNSEWNAIYNETKFDMVSANTALDDEINRSNLDRIVRARGGTGGELLEIGCGNGYFLREAKTAGFSVHGLELNERNCEKVRGELGPTVRNLDLFRAELPADTFDVIYMRDVFEHVPRPREMLVELHRIAAPDCVLFIEVPNIEGLIYKLVGTRHVCIFGFEHLNYWSPSTLRWILETTGFAVVETAFASLDFTVRDVMRAYLAPTHTTLYPQRLSRGSELALKLLDFAWSKTPLHRLDRAVMPRLADRSGRGSVVKVLARKVTTS